MRKNVADAIEKNTYDIIMHPLYGNLNNPVGIRRVALGIRGRPVQHVMQAVWWTIKHKKS